jgi:acyl-CoA thioester hydrolase
MEQPMMVEQNIPIRAYDVDAMGIVGNIVYVRWFEDLRHAFLDRYYPYHEMMGLNLSPVLIKTEVIYKAPLTIRDTPVGKCWMSNLGRTKWEMTFEIYSHDTLYCVGKQVGCIFDLEKNRAAPIPDRIIEEYKRELSE